MGTESAVAVASKEALANVAIPDTPVVVRHRSTHPRATTSSTRSSTKPDRWTHTALTGETTVTPSEVPEPESGL
jgi:hypothetical protein